MKKLILIMCSFLLLGLVACQQKSHRQTDERTSSTDNEEKGESAKSVDLSKIDTMTEVSDTFVQEIKPKYSKGFNVVYKNGMCLLSIQDPQKEEGGIFRYALVHRDGKVGRVPSGYTKIAVPIKSTICMTSLQLSNFIKLGALDFVKGMTSARHLFNADVKRRVASGKIHKIGMEGDFDNEVIIAINPEIILISPFKRGGYDALKEVGIPLIPHLGYKEMTPLGQAEWIKLIGLLTGREATANALFAGIEKRYNALRKLTERVKKRPVVFSGEQRGGNWYAVGGKSFLAQLFEDAGADYFMKDNQSSGGITLDYEKVYSQAANADYWRIVNSYDGKFSYQALQAEDARYVDFKAFKNKGVIYCNMSEKAFYESMPMEPEVVLADLIKAFHPELLPKHKAVFYELLK